MSTPATPPSPYRSEPLLTKRADEMVQSFETCEQRRSPGLMARIGYCSICSVVVGGVFILGAFGFVWFLWWSGGGNVLGRSIMVNGMGNAFCDTRLYRHPFLHHSASSRLYSYALALRWHKVHLPNAAAVSLLRFANLGPWSLIMALFDMGLTSLSSAGLVVLVLTLTTTLSTIIRRSAVRTSME
ncbi:hypothetical protein P280DRAFT_532641 [Massarina eburnea CBS 473.64]|uniref:Uncharacterized protein n=1 Tax=Massarina eburnea CBS 473.64 TaxID=1395130 RepID=A0A6A6RS26_9PLEO|nr:hypothetical protein P280DRAFT_532641 [Massarina eburnea CBS 473.64]